MEQEEILKEISVGKGDNGSFPPFYDDSIDPYKLAAFLAKHLPDSK